jgi:hypothetical protein
LSLDNDAVGELLNSFDSQIRALKEDALRMSWYMRGGLSYDDAMMLSESERKSISEIIKENLETTKKSGQPFF